MGYTPSKSDLAFWIKKYDDGHYEYIATYVADAISYSKDPMAVIKILKKEYILKDIKAPEYYLEGDVISLDET